MSNRVKRNLLPMLGVLVASLIFVLSQSFVLAQAQLGSRTPADNQVFKNNSLPERVTLTFSEALKPEGSTLTVVDAVRSRADRGTVTINDKTISVELNRNLVPADYSVEYSVVSQADGATTTGSYNFKVVPPPGNPLDIGYLFSTPTEAISTDWNVYFPWALVFLIVFLIGAIICNFFYFYGKYRFRNNLLNYTMINRATRNGAIVFSLGVFFFFCRIFSLQPLNSRIWLYLAAVLVIYYVVRGVIWRGREYPKAKAAWINEQQRQQRKKEPRVAAATATAIPAAKATVPKITLPSTSSGSADAGGEEQLGTSAVQDSAEDGRGMPATPRGLSQRGQKRREKKRDRR